MDGGGYAEMKAFANYHPAVLLAYFLSVISVEMFAVNPVFQLSALLGGILFCCMLSKRSEAAGSIGFYIPMFLLVAILFRRSSCRNLPC